MNKMRLPFSLMDHVLKFNCSFYGLCDLLCNFFKHLTYNLEKCKFVQSPHDPWFIICPNVIYVVYVNAYLFFLPPKPDIDQTIENIRQTYMILNVEDDNTGFLVVNIDHTDDGCATLTQTGCIYCILVATHGRYKSQEYSFI